MSFKLGLVGLCTSHPGSWVPVIRELAQAGVADVEVVAAWDSGETRAAGFAREFCAQHKIPESLDELAAMPDRVDGVIVHTANWDRHVEQAAAFVEAGKAVLLDKPIVGNLRDADVVLDWGKRGRRVSGGSSFRFCRESAELVAMPVEERGAIHTIHAVCGVDEFNYGIHAYSLLCGLMGPGVRSARYLGVSGQKQVMLTWRDGRIGLLTVGKNAWLPACATVVTDKKVFQVQPVTKDLYRGLLEAVLPYLTGATAEPPVPMDVLLEPELAAMAARVSWLHNGQEVFLTDLRRDDPGYDGSQFAEEYRQARG